MNGTQHHAVSRSTTQFHAMPSANFSIYLTTAWNCSVLRPRTCTRADGRPRTCKCVHVRGRPYTRVVTHACTCVHVRSVSVALLALKSRARKGMADSRACAEQPCYSAAGSIYLLQFYCCCCCCRLGRR